VLSSFQVSAIINFGSVTFCGFFKCTKVLRLYCFMGSQKPVKCNSFGLWWPKKKL